MGNQTRLSILWIFVMFNYLYCDIVSLMDSELLKQYLTGKVDGLELTPTFLLGAAVLMEIPISMIVLSIVTKQRTSRWLNIIAGTVMTLAQSATLLLGTPAMYYAFFSVIEIACTALIVWYAWKWRATNALLIPEEVPALDEPLTESHTGGHHRSSNF